MHRFLNAAFGSLGLARARSRRVGWIGESLRAGCVDGEAWIPES